MSERRLREQEDGWCSSLPQALTFFGFQHERIPPAADTRQTDLQTVYYLTGDEFYVLGTFRNRADSLANATLYQLYLIPPCGNELTRVKAASRHASSSSYLIRHFPWSNTCRLPSSSTIVSGPRGTV